ERRGANGQPWVGLAQGMVAVHDLPDVMGTQVVVGVRKADAVRYSLWPEGRAVHALVEHDDLGPVGRTPAEQRRQVRRRRGGVDPDVEKADAGLGEERNEAQRMTRNVSHLR